VPFCEMIGIEDDKFEVYASLFELVLIMLP
jgi:hypothetical protein